MLKKLRRKIAGQVAVYLIINIIGLLLLVAIPMYAVIFWGILGGK